MEWEYTWIIFKSGPAQSKCHVLTSHASSKSRQPLNHFGSSSPFKISIVPARDQTDADTGARILLLSSKALTQSFIITRFCANGRKRLMKGLKYVFDYTWGIIDPLRAGGHGQRVIHSSDLIKNNFCLCFMRIESMALRLLFVCNFLLGETFHWNVFRLFVTWYHLGVRWQFQMVYVRIRQI